MRQNVQQHESVQHQLAMQQSVNLTGISGFGRTWVEKMGNPWQVKKISAEVLFSNHAGPWMLLERDHFQRWVNLSADKNFLIRWDGWSRGL